MSGIWQNQAVQLIKLLDQNRDIQAHLYLERLMLFPVDVQDRIIDEVSHLTNCNSASVAKIIGRYSMFELQ